MTEEKPLLPEEFRSWKIKIQHVSGGYVRLTVHGDSVDEVITTWSEMRRILKEHGERFEPLMKGSD